MIPLGEYNNECECPPTTRLMSSTSWAIFMSFSNPECPKPMIILTPFAFKRFASSFNFGISSNISKFSVFDKNCKTKYVFVILTKKFLCDEKKKKLFIQNKLRNFIIIIFI